MDKVVNAVKKVIKEYLVQKVPEVKLDHVENVDWSVLKVRLGLEEKMDKTAHKVNVVCKVIKEPQVPWVPKEPSVQPVLQETEVPWASKESSAP